MQEQTTLTNCLKHLQEFTERVRGSRLLDDESWLQFDNHVKEIYALFIQQDVMNQQKQTISN